MRSFASRLFYFTAGFVLLNLVLYFLIFSPIIYEPYQADIDEIKGFDVFLMADSHGHYVDKDHLKDIDVYNLSYSSDSYIDILSKLNNLYSRSIKIDTLLLTVDAHTLSPMRETANNMYRSYFYTNELVYERFYSDKSHWRYIIERYMPLCNSNNSKLFLLYMLSLLNNTDSNVVTWENEQNQEALTSIRIKKQFPNMNKSEKLLESLEAIVKLTKENNTILKGIKFPISKMYFTHKANRTFGAQEYFETIGIKVFDFETLFLDDDSKFFNMDHLNQKGSKIFVQELEKEIIKLKS